MTNTTQVIETGYFLMGCASICSSDIPTPVLLLEALLLEELLDPLDLQVLDFFPLASFFFFSVFDPFLVLLLPLLLAFLSLLCFFLDLSFFLQAWCKDHSNGCSGVQLARSCGHNCSSLCTQIQHMNQYNTNAIIPLSVLEPTMSKLVRTEPKPLFFGWFIYFLLATLFITFLLLIIIIIIVLFLILILLSF